MEEYTLTIEPHSDNSNDASVCMTWPGSGINEPTMKAVNFKTTSAPWWPFSDTLIPSGLRYYEQGIRNSRSQGALVFEEAPRRHRIEVAHASKSYAQDATRSVHFVPFPWLYYVIEFDHIREGALMRAPAVFMSSNQLTQLSDLVTVPPLMNMFIDSVNHQIGPSHGRMCVPVNDLLEMRHARVADLVNLTLDIVWEPANYDLTSAVDYNIAYGPKVIIKEYQELCNALGEADDEDEYVEPNPWYLWYEAMEQFTVEEIVAIPVTDWYGPAVPLAKVIPNLSPCFDVSLDPYMYFRNYC